MTAASGAPGERVLDACTLVCEACSQPFKLVRHWQRFCSARCRWTAANARRLQARSGVVEPSNGAGHSAHFEDYFVAVRARLRQGEREYGGRSFSADPRVLLEEIRDELRDVAGWAFILDCRLERVAAAFDRVLVGPRG